MAVFYWHLLIDSLDSLRLHPINSCYDGIRVERRVMEYKVVSSAGANPDQALSDLIEEVNRMIEAGWKPLGGISYCQWSLFSNIYHQAMIYEATPEAPYPAK